MSSVWCRGSPVIGNYYMCHISKYLFRGYYSSRVRSDFSFINN